MVNLTLLTKSIVLALTLDSSLHHVSHHSHSCGNDLMLTVMNLKIYSVNLNI
jgi:hypothetical protein